MKTKSSDLVTCVLFFGFLSLMLVLFAVLPKEVFSETEKRYLEKSPELTWKDVLSGEFGESAETYLADHMPARNNLVGLNAWYDYCSGRQVTKDVYVAQGESLVEAPAVWDERTVSKNMKAINAFAEETGKTVEFMLVPSAGFVRENEILGLHDPYTDDLLIGEIYALAGEAVNCRDLLPVLTEPEHYYRTDHHWTCEGAYRAYAFLMEQLGRDYPSCDAFTVERYEGFYGSNHSRGGFWSFASDSVELWKKDALLSVTMGEASYDTLFFEERLEELDKYTVYLNGNQPLVRIENPEGEGSILVIRDSYANCLGTFLPHTYESVVLVDLRYYKEPVSELLAEQEIEDVLICYSIGNFLSDNNLIFLR